MYLKIHIQFIYFLSKNEYIDMYNYLYKSTLYIKKKKLIIKYQKLHYINTKLQKLFNLMKLHNVKHFVLLLLLYEIT